MTRSIALFKAPQADGRADAAPFRSDDATVRDVVLWHQDNPARKVASAVAETERRRIWQMLCEHRPDPSTGSTFGDRPCSQCRPFELLGFINALLGVAASDWTRKRWNATVQAPFNAAERLGLIVKNPFRGLSFPEGEDGRDWTDDEYQAILRNARPAFRRLVVALRFSGLRPGEGCGLAFPRISFEEGRIVIDQHKTRHRTKKPRVIPTNTVLVKLFDWLRRHNPPGRSGAILNSFGRPWVRSMADTTLRRLRARVNAQVGELHARLRPDGTDPRTGRRCPAKLLVGLPDDVKLHGARHTFCTQAQMNGVSLAAVSGILGHERLATTQRYSHVDTKVDHLASSMEQAVHRQPKPKRPAGQAAAPSQRPATPLFDGIG
jgi:integrase